MIAHVPKNNPIHTVGEQHRTAITAAQASVLDKQFRTAGEFWNTIGEHLKVKLALPTALQEQLPRAVFDKPAKTLANEFASILRNQLPAGAVVDRSIELAHRAQLVLAFHDPDAEIQAVTKRVREVVKDFPREPAHLMRGKNPGDVADPYALAAQLLLCGGTFGRAVETAVAHKAMMIVEGLLGHLHEDVLGAMRGNVRTTEPRKRKGKGSADALDPTTNPFPGADIVQPPCSKGQQLRFHQIKTKTSSQKGGDGKRPGERLHQLKDRYGGEVYFTCLVGTTLRGHRSRASISAACPDTIFLVGASAFEALTGSRFGAELLLRVYQQAFKVVAQESGYRLDEIATTISNKMQEAKTDADLGSILESILTEVTDGTPKEQDSRHEST